MLRTYVIDCDERVGTMLCEQDAAQTNVTMLTSKEQWRAAIPILDIHGGTQLEQDAAQSVMILRSGNVQRCLAKSVLGIDVRTSFLYSYDQE